MPPGNAHPDPPGPAAPQSPTPTPTPTPTPPATDPTPPDSHPSPTPARPNRTRRDRAKKFSEEDEKQLVDSWRELAGEYSQFAGLDFGRRVATSLNAKLCANNPRPPFSDRQVLSKICNLRYQYSQTLYRSITGELPAGQETAEFSHFDAVQDIMFECRRARKRASTRGTTLGAAAAHLLPVVPPPLFLRATGPRPRPSPVPKPGSLAVVMSNAFRRPVHPNDPPLRPRPPPAFNPTNLPLRRQPPLQPPPQTAPIRIPQPAPQQVPQQVSQQGPPVRRRLQTELGPPTSSAPPAPPPVAARQRQLSQPVPIPSKSSMAAPNAAANPSRTVLIRRSTTTQTLANGRPSPGTSVIAAEGNVLQMRNPAANAPVPCSGNAAASPPGPPTTANESSAARNQQPAVAQRAPLSARGTPESRKRRRPTATTPAPDGRHLSGATPQGEVRAAPASNVPRNSSMPLPAPLHQAAQSRSSNGRISAGGDDVTPAASVTPAVPATNGPFSRFSRHRRSAVPPGSRVIQATPSAGAGAETRDSGTGSPAVVADGEERDHHEGHKRPRVEDPATERGDSAKVPAASTGNVSIVNSNRKSAAWEKRLRNALPVPQAPSNAGPQSTGREAPQRDDNGNGSDDDASRTTPAASPSPPSPQALVDRAEPPSQEQLDDEMPGHASSENAHAGSVPGINLDWLTHKPAAPAQSNAGGAAEMEVNSEEEEEREAIVEDLEARRKELEVRRDELEMKREEMAVRRKENAMKRKSGLLGELRDSAVVFDRLGMREQAQWCMRRVQRLLEDGDGGD